MKAMSDHAKPAIQAYQSQMIAALAGTWADQAVRSDLIPSWKSALGLFDGDLNSLRKHAQTAESSLELVYRLYAFARRGRDRQQLAGIAVEALSKILEEQPTSDPFFSRSNASELWARFESICAVRGVKPGSTQNLGIVAGLAELTQSIEQSGTPGGIFGWIESSIRNSHRVEETFFRIVDIRGVGPKVASLLLRDTAIIFELEQFVEPQDRLFMQPIDKWIRAFAPKICDEVIPESAADWVLAGKIAKVARLAQVSAVRLNLGMSYFGSAQGRALVSVPDALGSLIRG